MSAEVAAVLTAHPSYSWVDNAGPCSGSKVVCNGPDCSWEVQLDGHNGDSRRALFPVHFAEELAKNGVGPVLEVAEVACEIHSDRAGGISPAAAAAEAWKQHRSAETSAA
jgi:hypothetical protein